MRGMKTSSWASLIHKTNELERKEDWQLTPKNFLLHYKDGVYTCSRTINHKILSWDEHVKRMGRTIIHMHNVTLNFLNFYSLWNI